MSLLIFAGLIVLAHGPTVAVVATGVLLVAFAVVIAVHYLRREKPSPEPVATTSRVYGSRRPSQHRRTSFVRHVADYRKTGVKL